MLSWILVASVAASTYYVRLIPVAAIWGVQAVQAQGPPPVWGPPKELPPRLISEMIGLITKGAPRIILHKGPTVLWPPLIDTVVFTHEK